MDSWPHSSRLMRHLPMMVGDTRLGKLPGLPLKTSEPLCHCYGPRDVELSGTFQKAVVE